MQVIITYDAKKKEFFVSEYSVKHISKELIIPEHGLNKIMKKTILEKSLYGQLPVSIAREYALSANEVDTKLRKKITNAKYYAKRQDLELVIDFQDLALACAWCKQRSVFRFTLEEFESLPENEWFSSI